jgi:hypothetical protein
MIEPDYTPQRRPPQTAVNAQELANLENQLRRALHAVWEAQGRNCRIVEMERVRYEVKATARHRP